MNPIGFITIVLIGLLSYLLGSINLSIIISKLMGKGDIRDYGSKNAGTTNTLRVLGKWPALIVLIWDVCKGALAVGLARGVTTWVSGWLATSGGEATFEFSYLYCFAIMLASICAILGHNYPAFFGFRGGKGVATSLGVILAIEPRIGLICLVVGVVGIALMQMVSIGSITAAIEYPILICIIGGQFDKAFNSNAVVRISYIVFSFILGLMVIFRHRANIERIRNGTENRLKFKKTAEEKIAEEKAKIQVKVEKKEDIKEEQPLNDAENTEDNATQEEPSKIETVDIKFEPKKEEDKKSKKKSKKE